jgi:5-methylcytosine-specific restriction endonuclease McrA
MTTFWTEGRLKAFITSALRGAFRKYPPKYETLKEASVGKKINTKTKRLAEHYVCNHCKQEFPSKEVNVDHISPCVDTKTGFVNWDVYINRMFCIEYIDNNLYINKDNLQVLCTSCHDIKTKEENQTRKTTRANSKKSREKK